MGIFAYAPGIRVFIDTRTEGVLDVSDDLTRGTMILNENAPHSFRFAIKNHKLQYDGIFTPNDKIHVQMKRITWLPIFSGYLNRVPIYSAHPRDISLSASCSLKRLQYRLWDPGTDASMALLDLQGDGTGNDGGMRDRVIRLLTEVAGWPSDLIHIGAIPEGWFSAISGLYDTLSGRIGATAISVGTLASFGTPPAGAPGSGGGASGGPTTTEGIGPGTGALPYSSGKVSWFGGPNGGAYGNMQLTGESGTYPADQHYTAMRFPYYDPNTIKPIHSPEQTRAAINWWRNRKILVTNPKNNRQVVLRAADWGPNIRTGKNLDMSRQSLEQTLQGATNDVMNFAFAPLDAPLGLYSGPAAIGTADGGAAQGGAGGGTGTPAAPPSGGSGKIETNGASVDSLSPGGKAMAQVVADRARDGGFRAVVTSTVRSNSKTNHGPGRRTAIDYGLGSGTNGMKLFNAMLPYQSQLAELFFTPAGFSIKNGQRVAPIAAAGHHDHVHMASASTETFDGKAGAPGGVGGGGNAESGEPGGPGGPIIERFTWDPKMGDPQSNALSGIRALINDEPILPMIEALIHTSMRSYCSAPNGDFIGWFPDYFGVYGTAGKMVIRNIELEDFTIDWDDAALKTHVFTAGASAGFAVGGQLAAEVESMRRLYTAGIATVEFREMMEALFNVTAGKDPYGFLESATFLNRFGARQKYVPMGNITGQQAEFFYACFLFQQSWSEQFTANIPMTFMPELFPGMLIQLPDNIQAYVQAVTHSFDFNDGMGFDTNVDTAALSATSGSGIAVLPRGGRRLI